MKNVLFLVVLTAFFYACSKSEDNLPGPLTSLTLSADSVAIMPGEEINLTYTYTPEKTTDIVSVLWKIENTDIANFDIYDQGTIYGKNPGKTYVVAYFRDRPEITDTCTIRVLPRDVKRIEIDKKNLEIFVGRDTLLRATVYPENATYQDLKWSSSNESIATVENGKVSARSAGTADIIVETLDGSVKATCKVQVKNIPVSSIVIDNLSKTQKWLVGEELQLTYKVYPENAFNKKIKISSSDESVVQIDENFKLKVLSKGEATITVASEDGNTSEDYQVTTGDITLFITYGISGAYTNLNGIITGTVYFTLYNGSNRSIDLTSIIIFNGYGTQLNIETSDVPGQILPYSNKSVGIKFNGVYYPKFTWYYTFEGKTYQFTYDMKQD